MINFNGTLSPLSENLLANNRAFLFGDGVFETIKILDNKILFLEDHYFRLMSAMRIIRMEIPMNFTMEYFETQILVTAQDSKCLDSGRIRLTIYRSDGGYYLPKTNTVGFLIQAEILENRIYSFDDLPYEVDLYKDFYVTKQLLSSVKTTNKILNITASIFASENGLQNCLLLNDSKNVVEAIQGNIFMLTDHQLITPPISDGCINGVMRKQILNLAKKIENLEVREESISPFDLQQADELFITNVIKGILPIKKYRKKEFQTNLATDLLLKLNALVKLS